MTDAFVFVGGCVIVQDGATQLTSSTAVVQLDVSSADVQLTSSEAVVQLSTKGKPV